MNNEQIQVLTDVLMVLDTTEAEALRQADAIIESTGESVGTYPVKIGKRAFSLAFFEHVGKYRTDENGETELDYRGVPIIRTDTRGNPISYEKHVVFRPLAIVEQGDSRYTLIYNQQAGQLVFDVNGGDKQFVQLIQGASEEERKANPKRTLNKNTQLQKDLLFNYLSIMFEQEEDEDEDW